MIQSIQFFAIKQVFGVKAAIRFKNLPGRFPQGDCLTARLEKVRLRLLY